MDAAMSSAVSALLAQSSALSTVSNNLANSQTTGYKSVSTTFSSLLTDLSGTTTAATSGGVSATARQDVTAQGTITSTSVTTDLAISGSGMFAVSYGLSGGQTYYTRDGAFDTDSSGNLYLSGTDYYLEGYSVVDGVTSSTLSVVNIDSQETLTPKATTDYSLSATLPASAQDDLGTLSYTSSSGTTEDLSATYVEVSSDSTAGTTTYDVAINAVSGTTISDGSGSASQLLYSVTVDSSGTIVSCSSLTSGDTYSGTTLPDITPSDSSSSVTLSSNYTNWSSFATAVGTGYSESTSMVVYDSLGVAETASVTWTAAGDNTWLMTVKASDGQTLTDSNGSSVSSYSYEVSFNSDGTYAGVTSLATGETSDSGTAGSAPVSSSGEAEISAIWSDDASASTGAAAISLDFGTVGKSDGLSQYSSSSSTTISVSSYSQDGYASGTLEGVAVDSSGDVVGTYSNGQTATIYKVPVVTFANENGLTELSDGVYEETASSGDAMYKIAGTDGAGSIEGSALESSTVDTTTEFAKMITTQQAYSAASQVISTDRDMFTALLQTMA
ncbi:flagellar hook-basal body complex protein [Telmatospirillum sp.]|uniref:flagellar hook protein FlgE n=1 Tax=Telmatospirillum sp. TaxID=2079197 RepID=UPI00283AD478|nr:flagellar hook-basal body complex protein [Telmatospirillum sp.]MDR3439766.1 flagellar hook-basal body complex protein [Telmatospirillum sp.]